MIGFVCGLQHFLCLLRPLNSGSCPELSLAYTLSSPPTLSRPFHLLKKPLRPRQPIHLSVPCPPALLRVQACGEGGCRPRFLGNTMTQHTPDGHLMFLHTNLSPKWSLQVPADFGQYTRRWQVCGAGYGCVLGRGRSGGWWGGMRASLSGGWGWGEGCAQKQREAWKHPW